MNQVTKWILMLVIVGIGYLLMLVPSHIFGIRGLVADLEAIMVAVLGFMLILHINRQ